MTLTRKEINFRYQQKKKLTQHAKDIFARWQTWSPRSWTTKSTQYDAVIKSLK